MATITEAQRVKRINELLGELTKLPPDKQHATIEIPGPGGQSLFCKVITIGVDEVVLNPSSHRIQAQLLDDPEWTKHKADPFGEGAQRIIQRMVREARTPKEFAALKESLAKDGQAEPGVVTSKGVLINANTRAVALRELDEPSKRYIKVAVLPDTMQTAELSLLELHLQMRKEHKAAYTFTNELLFIEELSVKRHMPNQQIAAELDIERGNPDKGAKVIQARLAYLDLIRTIQELPTDKLPLAFFDTVSNEHLEQLHRAWIDVTESDPAEATRILETFLLSVAVGFSDVKKLRKVDPEFIGDYVIPQLEEDELLGAQVARIAATAPDAAKKAPSGVDALLSDPIDDEPEVNLGALVDAVTRDDRKVPVPGPGPAVILDRDDVKGALKTALEVGVREKTRDATATNKLQAPLELMSQAASAVEKCQKACAGVVATDEFGDTRRKTLEVKYKRLLKSVRSIESDLVKMGVVPKKRA
ncbi:MAG TPA: hypothetical protein VF364_09220 [Candidatus Limnocylindria bacterium]